MRGLNEWGFNVQRRVQRLQETSRWASPVASTTRSTRRAARACSPACPTSTSGSGLSVRPSLVAGFAHPAPDARPKACSSRAWT